MSLTYPKTLCSCSALKDSTALTINKATNLKILDLKILHPLHLRWNFHIRSFSGDMSTRDSFRLCSICRWSNPCTGPEGSRRFGLPDFNKIGTWSWYGYQPYAPAALTPPGDTPASHLCQRLSWTQGHSAAGRITDCTTVYLLKQHILHRNMGHTELPIQTNDKVLEDFER